MKRFLLAAIAIFAPLSAKAECLKVTDDAALTLNEAQLSALQPINYGRDEFFRALYRTSLYETNGCWATPTGNFDAQSLSVGVLQWNFGQNSLQPLLNAYKARFDSDAAFKAELSQIMPKFGGTLFSTDCLNPNFNDACKAQILAQQDEKWKLKPEFGGEIETLFNSNKMRQVQVDKFVEFLTDLSPKITLLFPKPNEKSVAWSIDLAIQSGFVTYGNGQKAILNPADVTTIRKLEASLNPQTKRTRAYSILHWYQGLCGGIYQGVKTDQCNFNLQNWCAVIKHGMNDEDFDLFNLTYVRSRIAQGQSGRWQANAFARRAKIALGTGQVGDDKVDLPPNIKPNSNCNMFLVPIE